MPRTKKAYKSSNRPFILSIEGNIGSGKSTLLKYLSNEAMIKEKKTKWIFLQEPIDDWESIKDKDGTTMLEKFYGNQDKYAFSFQMMAYISRLAKIKKAVDENPGAIIITERSLNTDKYVFAKMLYDSGKIEEVNYQIYQTWFNTFVKDYPISGYIYVNTDPKICCERVNKRSREGEDAIALSYLESCHDYHVRMMDEQNDVLTIQGNNEFNEEKDIWSSMIEDWVYGKFMSQQNGTINREEDNIQNSIWISDIPLI